MKTLATPLVIVDIATQKDRLAFFAKKIKVHHKLGYFLPNTVKRKQTTKNEASPVTYPKVSLAVLGEELLLSIYVLSRK